MLLTNERAEKLGNYLTADKDRAEGLLSMTPEKAVLEINKSGYDFSVDEVIEFGRQIAVAGERIVPGTTELEEAALSEVSGGVITELTAAACVAAVALGYTIGKDLANRIPW